MPRRGWSRLILAVALVAALARVLSGSAAAAAPEPVVATLTLQVHADGVSSTPVDTYLRIEAPANRPDIAGVLANRPGTPPYRNALQRLLTGLGLYGGGIPLPVLASIYFDGPPDVSVDKGRATLLFSGTRDLGLYTAGNPALWYVSRSGKRVRFCLQEDAPVPSGVRWNVEAYTLGAEVISEAPPPDERIRVADFPPAPDAQTPPQVPARAEHGKGVDRLVWHPSGTGGTATIAPCAPSVAGGSDARGLDFELDLSRQTRVLVASYAGTWARVRLALSYVISGLVLIPLLYLLLRGSGPRRALRERRWAWAALFGSLAIVAGGVLMWLWRPSAPPPNAGQFRPPLIAGAVAFCVALAPHRRRPRDTALIVGAIAVVTGLAIWTQREAAPSAFLSGGWIRLAQAAWAAFAIAALTLAAVAVLAVAGRGRGRAVRWLALVVAVASVILVFQAASAEYHNWQVRHDAAKDLNPGLLSAPWHSWASGGLVYFPQSFVGLVADLLPIVAFTAILALLASAGAKASSTLIPDRRVLTGLVLVFAAFVAGTQGTLYGWGLPIAFVAALALGLVLRRRKIEKTVDEIDRLNPDLERPVALLSRGELLAQAAADPKEPKKGPILPPGVSPASIALSLGPGRTWWQNGVIALRTGAVLSIAPLLFYAYVFATKRLGHDLSFAASDGFADLVRSSVHELLVWLAASFVLGALFPYLPSAAGAAKGATMGLVYTGATGLEMWILPGNQDWIFRCLEVLLFLVALGVLLDRKTLTENGVHWRYLLEYYRVGDLRFTTAYASVALGAVLAIVQQLHSGNAQDAIAQIIKNLPSLIPPVQ